MASTDDDTEISTKPYRLLYGIYTRQENGISRTYRTGNTILLTDEQRDTIIQKFGHRVELITETIETEAGSENGEQGNENEDEAGEAIDHGPSHEAWSDLLARSVPEIAKVLESIDSPADLQSILETEQQGAARLGVAKAVEKRLEELQPEIG